MRSSWKRGVVVASVGALVLAGCGSDDDTSQDGSQQDATAEQAGEGDDPQAGTTDPNDDVEDGIYRGNGVVVPVPDGWSLDQAAFAQGVVAVVSDDGDQQLSARAIDASELESAGQDVDLDALIDNVRQLGDADVDEPVELQGAARAHQVTYLDVPAPQEGAPASSATIVLAEDGSGRLGEFLVGGTPEAYDEELVALLLEQSGFDPDSSPPPLPAPPTAPAPQPAPDDAG